MITYQLSSHPWIFHLVNLIYFAIDVWLVFLLTNLLTKNKWVALATTGIFLIHPLNTETVNWIATVPELLYTAFILASTYFFIRFRQTKQSRYLWRCCITYTLGIFAKEPAVFLPFVFILLDFTYFNRKIKDFFHWETISPYLISLLSFIVYFLLRITILGGLGGNPEYFVTIPQRLYIFIDLFGAYTRKLLFPYPLNLFYTFHPTYTLFNVDFISSFLILIGFIALFIIAVKNKWKLVSLSLAWYIAFLAPSLIFISSIGENLFAERHVFASTIGFALLLALILDRMQKKGIIWRNIVIILLIVASTSSWIIIYQRNSVWKTDEAIYADTLLKSPDADLIRYNLALMYRADGKIAQAKEHLHIIISRGEWPALYKTYNNLGDIVRREGKMDEAEKNFLLALKSNPYHVQALNNLGALYQERGDMLKSILYLCQANRIDPNFQDANNNLDVLSNKIQGMDAAQFNVLYQQLLSNGIFHPIKTNNQLAFKQKDCTNPNSCFYTFTNTTPQNTSIFSLLVAGKTLNGEIVRPNRIGIQQSTRNYILDIDKKWTGETTVFYFPTCDGVYYQANSVEK